MELLFATAYCLSSASQIKIFSLTASVNEMSVSILVCRYCLSRIPNYRYCQTTLVLEALVVTYHTVGISGITFAGRETLPNNTNSKGLKWKK